MKENVERLPAAHSRELDASIRQAVEGSHKELARQLKDMRGKLDGHLRAERPNLVSVDAAADLPTPHDGALGFVQGEEKWYYADGTQWVPFGGGGGGAMVQHALSGIYHSGEITTAQATWAATKEELAALDIHPRQHDVLNPLDHIVNGVAWQIVGLPADDTLGLLMPQSDVTGATKEALLKSNSSGHVSIVRGTASDRLRSPLIDTALGNLTIAPAADIVLDPAGNDILPATNYDLNLGAINKKFLTIWAAELWVETLVAQETIATIGGRVLVGPTTSLTRDLAPADTQVYVKHNQMSPGDTAYLEGGGFVEFVAITSAYTTIGANEYRYDVTRNLDGSGANQWYAGDALFNTGQTGNGFIDLYSLAGIPRAGQTSSQRAGPTIVGNVRLSSTFNDFRERWAIGVLNGLYDYGNDEVGAAFGNPLTAWIGMDATNGWRVMQGAVKRAQLDTSGNLRLYNPSGTAVIALDSSGTSYFADVMTIGTGGEIRQGTGTWASNWTGVRLWNDGGVGRIGGYKSSALQWYADTTGELRAGGGVVSMAAQGLGMARYITPAGTPVAGTESTATVAWWDDINSRTGSPLARIYAARSEVGAGGVPSLSIEVDPSNADTNSRPSIWLVGKSALPTQLYINYVDQILGIPGLFPQRNPTTRAETVDFSGTLNFKAHLLRWSGDADVDIGTAGNPFRTLYATNVIATSISGTAMSGQEWEYAGSMQIDANSAANTTVTIANSGDGAADLVVDRNISLGGTVDGVDLASFYAAYGAHNHTLASLTTKPHSALTGIGADDHHSQSHAYDSADHTGTLSWAKLSKTGSSLADLATRLYADLQSRGHGILSADHTVTGAAWQIIGLTAANTLGLLTPSSDVTGATKEALLKSTALGNLTLVGLTATTGTFTTANITTGNITTANVGLLDMGTDTLTEDATYLQVAGAKEVNFGQAIRGGNAWRITTVGGLTATAAAISGNVSVTSGGDLSVAGSGAYAGVQVLFADSSGGNVGINCVPDPQFALDVAGPARASIFYGPLGLILKNVTLLAHYDGRTPYETNFSGEPNGHMGQVATATGGVIFRPGKFDKALQMAGATQNDVPNSRPNPSGSTTGWHGHAYDTTGSLSPSSVYVADAPFVGNRAISVGYTFSLASIVDFTARAGTYTITAWVRVVGRSDGDISLGMGWGGTGSSIDYIWTPTTLVNATDGEWYKMQFTAPSTTVAATRGVVIKALVPSSGAYTLEVANVQAELSAYATPYCDGSLGGYDAAGIPTGAGHAWAGTAYASASTRTTANLTYPQQLSTLAGTIMMWVYRDTAAPAAGAGLWAAGASGIHDAYLQSNGAIIFRSNSVALPTAAGKFTAGQWVHLAFTWSAATGVRKVYVNGQEEASGAYTAPTLGVLFYVGGTASGTMLDGLVDDLVILPRAETQIKIRAIVESDAPPAAEVSRYVFRATPKGLVWADDEGLWVRDALGNDAFGVYGGEAATKSWGGLSLEAGDVLIGRGANYVHWNNSDGTMVFAGDGAGLTSINGGNITTGTISTARLSVSNLADIAGTLVVGTTNKLWLNDAGDGSLAIGGTVKASAPFKVTAAGALTSTSGKIADWTIASTYLVSNYIALYSGPTGTARLEVGNGSNIAGIVSGTNVDSIAFWAGSAIGDAATAKFRVTLGGALVADSANITGEIKATSGRIGGTTGGWIIGNGLFYSNNIGIYSGATGTARIEVGASSTIAGMLSGASGASVAFWAGSTYSGAASAPYRVTMDGSFTATKGAVGDIDIADNAIYIAAPTTYSLSTKGYKFKRASDAVLMGGMTDYYSSALGINYIHLDNNITTGAGSASNAFGAETYVRAAASGAGKIARVEASAYYSGSGARIALSDDGTTKAIALTGNALTYNANTIWHAGNDGTGTGLDADLLDNVHASAFARLDGTGATFTGAVTFSNAINTNGTVVFSAQSGDPAYQNEKAVMYLKKINDDQYEFRVRLSTKTGGQQTDTPIATV